uniref:Uncharacterized protein n=1 Tax=Picea glauca TaxID=3330 RepID=A0A101LXQ6_PICGL|nr:hypothetical protein ABT39_MTgene5444 [Picea glauca]
MIVQHDDGATLWMVQHDDDYQFEEHTPKTVAIQTIHHKPRTPSPPSPPGTTQASTPR